MQTTAPTTNADLKSRETISLIAADKVDGTEVRNANGDSLGTIERVMLDKKSGKVAYAVMRFGGFLGLGADRHPVPWTALTYDDRLGSYVLNMTKEQLQNAPRVGDDFDRSFNDSEWREPLYKHYGTTPYWG